VCGRPKVYKRKIEDTLSKWKAAYEKVRVSARSLTRQNNPYKMKQIK
jgi:hypothetical protein